MGRVYQAFPHETTFVPSLLIAIGWSLCDLAGADDILRQYNDEAQTRLAHTYKKTRQRQRRHIVTAAYGDA